VRNVPQVECKYLNSLTKALAAQISKPRTTNKQTELQGKLTVIKMDSTHVK
jgi:hypothetical protein